MLVLHVYTTATTATTLPIQKSEVKIQRLASRVFLLTRQPPPPLPLREPSNDLGAEILAGLCVCAKIHRATSGPWGRVYIWMLIPRSAPVSCSGPGEYTVHVEEIPVEGKPTSRTLANHSLCMGHHSDIQFVGKDSLCAGSCLIASTQNIVQTRFSFIATTLFSRISDFLNLIKNTPVLLTVTPKCQRTRLFPFPYWYVDSKCSNRLLSLFRFDSMIEFLTLKLHISI